MKRTFVPAHPGFFQLSAYYGDDGQLFRDDAGNPTCNRTPVLAWRVTEHEEEKAKEKGFFVTVSPESLCSGYPSGNLVGTATLCPDGSVTNGEGEWPNEAAWVAYMAEQAPKTAAHRKQTSEQTTRICELLKAGERDLAAIAKNVGVPKSRVEHEREILWRAGVLR